MMIITLFLKFKEKVKYRRFQRNAVVGRDFSCTHGANCVNGGDRSHITIAENCEICGVLCTNADGQIHIGDHTTIRYDSRVESGNSILIGSHVIISNNVIIRDNNTHPTDPEKRWVLSESGFYGDAWDWKHAADAPIVIHDNVWIGERAIIYKGVEIGVGSIVAGGAVVTKSFPPYSVIAGNPARLVKNLR